MIDVPDNFDFDDDNDVPDEDSDSSDERTEEWSNEVVLASEKQAFEDIELARETVNAEARGRLMEAKTDEEIKEIKADWKAKHDQLDDATIDVIKSSETALKEETPEEKKEELEEEKGENVLYRDLPWNENQIPRRIP